MKKKFFRLLNFVRKLIKLSKPLEEDFEQHISQTKIQKAMQADKEFLTHYPVFFGKAVAEIREEGREEGLEQGREQEREHLIMNARRIMGFSAEQIAKINNLQVLYVQSIIDKFEKKE
jgi:flagellar biosynthesis/type III secretory pathway protein FliH